MFRVRILKAILVDRKPNTPASSTKFHLRRETVISMIPTKKHLGALFLAAIAMFGLATLVTVAPPAHAQAISGDITGEVADANNAVIPRASIEAKNVATGVSYAASTNEVGVYRFSNLPAGLYDLTITAKGFTTSVLKGFRVELNKVSTAERDPFDFGCHRNSPGLCSRRGARYHDRAGSNQL